MRKHYRIPRWNRLIWKANQTDPLTWTVSTYMIIRAQPWRAAGVCQVGICLALGLLPSAGPAAPTFAPETEGSWVSRPYLTVVAAFPLRFEERPAPPPVRLVTTDTSGRPQTPAVQPPATLGQPQSSPAESKRAEAPVLPSTNSSSPASSNPPPKEKPEKPTSPPPAILPDDTRPKVRPEDFLPFFQFPVSGANQEDVTVVPAPTEPGKLPPSTATYRQQ
jgi:hypothetical protein